MIGFFLAEDIICLLESFEVPPYTCLFKGDTSERRNIFHNCHIKNQDKLNNHWGFELEIKPSTIPEGKCFTCVTKTIANLATYSRKPDRELQWYHYF